jgi:hypothetical protein
MCGKEDGEREDGDVEVAKEVAGINTLHLPITCAIKEVEHMVEDAE